MDVVDRDALIRRILITDYGDANLDRVFDAEDLLLVWLASEYEDGVAANSTWAEGDWNADGEFNRADLVLALQTGLYETK